MFINPHIKNLVNQVGVIRRMQYGSMYANK
jgi:hypothetical protein